MNANNEFSKDYMRYFLDSKLRKDIKHSDILQHPQMMETVIRSLCHTDICIARGALLILTSLVLECNQSEIMNVLLRKNGINLMRAIVLVLNAKCILLRKFAIDLLTKLCTFANGINWNRNEMIKNQLLCAVKECESQWIELKKNEFYAFGDWI